MERTMMMTGTNRVKARIMSMVQATGAVCRVRTYRGQGTTGEHVHKLKGKRIQPRFHGAADYRSDCRLTLPMISIRLSCCTLRDSKSPIKCFRMRSPLVEAVDNFHFR